MQFQSVRVLVILLQTPLLNGPKTTGRTSFTVTGNILGLLFLLQAFNNLVHFKYIYIDYRWEIFDFKILSSAYRFSKVIAGKLT